MDGSSNEVRYPYVHVDVPAERSDEMAAELFSLGATGVEERDGTTLARSADDLLVTLVASFAEEDLAYEVADYIGEQFPARVEFVLGDGWRDAWREYFKPTRIGSRLLLRPSWEEVQPSAGDVVLTLDPGRAFGSGTHETTRLVLSELERSDLEGKIVLDAGCGSGILGIAALLLGARSVTAVDVDPDAVEVTYENAVLNAVRDRVEASTTPVAELPGTFELVLANIEARVLLPMAPDLVPRVAPGGLLVLSGILGGQEDELIAAYTGLGLGKPRVAVDGEWVAIVLEREGA